MQKKYRFIFIAWLLAGCALVQNPTPEANLRVATQPVVEVEKALPTATAESAPTPDVLPSDTPELAPLPDVIPSETPELAPLPAAVETYAVPAGDALEPFSSGTRLDIHHIRMLTQSAGWAVAGKKGGDAAQPEAEHILTTQDGGKSWFEISPPQPANGMPQVALLEAASPAQAWVVYSPADIQETPGAYFVWRTQDGGETWQPSNLLDTSGLETVFFPDVLQFVDPLHGWLLVHVGAGMSHDYVVLYQSQDGGVTWQRILDPLQDASSIQSCQKTGLDFADAQAGWLSGDCGGVAPGAFFYQTVDGGVSWSAIELPAPEGIDFNDPGLACGTHSPQRWSVEEGKIALHCLDYSGDNPLERFYLYSTKDGGQNWSLAAFPGGDLFFVDAQNGWALGATIYQTTDGGQTWQESDRVTWKGQFDFINAQEGWAAAKSEAGEYGLVTSKNGGARWTLLDPVVH